MNIVVLFPGVGYHCDKPLLYYSKKLAQSKYDKIIALSYNSTTMIKAGSENINKVFDELYEQTLKELKDIIWSEYDQILFISKSIGTLVASKYQIEHKLKCKNILFTPLTEIILGSIEGAIAFTGTKDQWANSDKMLELFSNTNNKIFMIKNANHSLETEDVIGNIKIMKNIMEEVENYIS